MPYLMPWRAEQTTFPYIEKESFIASDYRHKN